MIRRYSDFEAFYKYLRLNYEGIVIPPIPEKDFKTKFSNQVN